MIFWIGEYLTNLQARTWLSRGLSSSFSSVLARRTECTRQPRFFARYSPNWFFFSDRLGSKPFLIWLLKTSLHLKYIATLPGNFSLIACFVTLMFDKIVWQHIRGVVGYINHFATYLPRNLSEKIFWKSVKIWQNYSHEFVASIFLAHPLHTAI